MLAYPPPSCAPVSKNGALGQFACKVATQPVKQFAVQTRKSGTPNRLQKNCAPWRLAGRTSRSNGLLGNIEAGAVEWRLVAGRRSGGSAVQTRKSGTPNRAQKTSGLRRGGSGGLNDAGGSPQCADTAQFDVKRVLFVRGVS